MKKIIFFTLISSLLMLTNQGFTQSSTCDNVTIPEVTSGMNPYEVGGAIWTPAPPMSQVASGLPTTEYLIVKVGACALDSARVNCDTTNGGGDVIIGGDNDGIFDPGTISRYGISIEAGDTFAVIAIAYDLAQIRALLNTVLTGTTLIGAPCCGIFDLNADTEGFCDTLNSLGITSQNDINGIEDFLTVFDAFTNAQLSVNGLVSYMEQVNDYSNTVSAAGCGTVSSSGDLICYGVNPSKQYQYKAASTVAVQELEAVKNLKIFPNPTNGNVMLNFETEYAKDLRINIYNALGQSVLNQQLIAVNTAQSITLETSKLTAGLYMVELTDGKNSITSKLMVQ